MGYDLMSYVGISLNTNLPHATKYPFTNTALTINIRTNQQQTNKKSTRYSTSPPRSQTPLSQQPSKQQFYLPITMYIPSIMI